MADQKFAMVGFASTGILKSASYNTKPIEMVILAPAGQSGAGYIDNVLYNTAQLGKTEAGHTLSHKHEILLLKGAKFTILEAQKFNDKTIIVGKSGKEDV